MTRRALGTVVALALAVTALTSLSAGAPTPGEPARVAEAPRTWLKQSGAPEVSSKQGGGSSWGPIAAGVLLASLVAGALYRRRQLRRLAVQKRVSRIRVLEATRVGAKAQLVTALVGERVLLLGVTDAQVSALGWLEPDELGTGEQSGATAVAAVRPGERIDALASKYAATEPTPHVSAAARFKGVLRDAMGGAAERDVSDDMAAVRLANRTQDVVACSREAVRRSADARASDAMDVEGQAAGLIARLSKGRQ